MIKRYLFLCCGAIVVLAASGCSIASALQGIFFPAAPAGTRSG